MEEGRKEGPSVRPVMTREEGEIPPETGNSNTSRVKDSSPVLAECTWKEEYLRTKYSVSKDIAVDNIQSVRVFPHNIFSQ